MVRQGHEASTALAEPDVQLSFITPTRRPNKKMALRLDGIYFNTRQNWTLMNAPIRDAHRSADLVIYQTNFNKRLSEKYFGDATRSVVISNGTSLDDIASISPIEHPDLQKFEDVWCCASSWRPHKRLEANIRYFLQSASEKTALVVLGENPDVMINHPRVIYAGKQTWETCVSVYKRASRFIHLAFLDHCPNVVVDARACGCDIVISSSGGTREIAGPNASVVEDTKWDMRPLDLYAPPTLDFARTTRNGIESNIDIKDVARRYIDALSVLL